MPDDAPITQPSPGTAGGPTEEISPEPEERGPVLLRQKLAIVLFVVSGPIVAMDYWKNGGHLTFFGEVPLNTLIEIASLGGAISFLLYAKGREMPWAWIPGAIAGFGAFYVHIGYTVWFQKESLWNVESILVALVGALPGLLMYCGISKILRPRRKARDAY